MRGEERKGGKMQKAGNGKKLLKTVLAMAAVLWLILHGAGYLFILFQTGWRLGVGLPLPLSVDYADDHGGFHGDGETVCCLSFGEGAGETLKRRLEESGCWRVFPAPQEIEQLLYELPLAEGFRVTFAEASRLTRLENGYWFFADRDDSFRGHAPGQAVIYGIEAVNGLENRLAQGRSLWPYNFDLAVYDPEARILYFFALDI